MKYKIVFFLFISSSILAQETKFGQRFEVEVNGFYFIDILDNQFNNYTFNITSIGPAFSFNLNKNIYLGVRSYIVRLHRRISPQFTSWHTLLGPTLKYRLVDWKRLELDTEISYLFGNYCSLCPPENKHYNSSIQYLSLFVGLNFQLLESAPKWWLKLSAKASLPMNNLETEVYYSPFLGIQYKFGKIKEK